MPGWATLLPGFALKKTPCGFILLMITCGLGLGAALALAREAIIDVAALSNGCGMPMLRTRLPTIPAPAGHAVKRWLNPAIMSKC